MAASSWSVMSVRGREPKWRGGPAEQGGQGCPFLHWCQSVHHPGSSSARGWHGCGVGREARGSPVRRAKEAAALLQGVAAWLQGAGGVEDTGSLVAWVGSHASVEGGLS